MNKETRTNSRIVKSAEPTARLIAAAYGDFLGNGGPAKEIEKRASVLVYTLARFAQEIAFCAFGGDVEKGMRLLSEAVNHSQKNALKTLAEVKKMHDDL